MDLFTYTTNQLEERARMEQVLAHRNAPAVSSDPETTVTALVYVRNLLVMGSIPPVVSAEVVAEARAHHGDAYTDELIGAMRMYGIKVEA
jgi:hypothetical protein